MEGDHDAISGFAKPANVSFEGFGGIHRAARPIRSGSRPAVPVIAKQAYSQAARLKNNGGMSCSPVCPPAPCEHTGLRKRVQAPPNPPPPPIHQTLIPHPHP